MRKLSHALACLVVAAGAASLPAAAQGVFKCKQANGQLAYQDHPCSAGAQDAGIVNSGYASAPASQDGDSAASHYQNYLDMVDRDRAQRQAERDQQDAEERRRQSEPQPMQADQRDYRRHICQAQLDDDLMHHRYSAFSCDANGNKVPVQPAVIVKEDARR